MKKVPDWPQQIINQIKHFKYSGSKDMICDHRRSESMQKIKKIFQLDIFHNFVGETRFHTIMIDALLPLIAAKKLMDTEALWLDWWVGDKPHSSTIYLDHLLPKLIRSPNRNAWIQGIYGLLLKQFSRISEIPTEHSQRDASKVHFRQ